MADATRNSGRLTGLVIAGAAIISALAVFIAVATAVQALGRDNTWSDYFYPFFAAPFGVLMAALGTLASRRRPDNRLGAVISLLGLAWSINALLVAARGYADTPGGAGWPQAAIAWFEDWFYLVNDLGTMTLLLLLYPSGRIAGLGWKTVTGSLGAAVAVIALTGMFAAHVEDNTHLQNPLGLLHLPDWIGAAVPILYMVVLVIGVVAALVKTVIGAIKGGRLGRYHAKWRAAMVFSLVLGLAVTMATMSNTPGAWISWFGVFVGALAIPAFTVIGLVREPAAS